jgi:hypothetical protein
MKQVKDLINQLLVVDVLIEIFKFLNGKDLDEARRVCMLWEDIISTTSVLNNKINLIINYNNKDEAKEKLKSFKYKNVFLSDPIEYDMPVDDVDKMLSDSKSYIERLGIHSVPQMSLLPQFTNLKHLYLDVCLIDQVLQKVDLPHLTSLTVARCMSLIKLIGNHQIKNLAIYRCNSDDVENFLKRCPKLENLEINFIPLNEYDFNLTKLKFHISEKKLKKNVDEFNNFLNSQRKTLSSLFIKIKFKGNILSDKLKIMLNPKKLTEHQYSQISNYLLKWNEKFESDSEEFPIHLTDYASVKIHANRSAIHVLKRCIGLKIKNMSIFSFGWIPNFKFYDVDVFKYADLISEVKNLSRFTSTHTLLDSLECQMHRNILYMAPNATKIIVKKDDFNTIDFQNVCQHKNVKELIISGGISISRKEIRNFLKSKSESNLRKIVLNTNNPRMYDEFIHHFKNFNFQIFEKQIDPFEFKL